MPEEGDGVELVSLTGEEIYQVRCAGCHTNPATKAPSLMVMAEKNRAAIRFALSNGKMRTQASGLDFEERESVVEYISDVTGDYQPGEADYCARREINLSRVYSGQRGFDASGSAAVAEPITRINAGNVSGLQLAFSFALPNATEARSQPVITTDTLFVAATTTGEVFALDRLTGCIRWHTGHGVPIRTSLTLLTSPRPLLVFGDFESVTTALDAKTGDVVWQTDVDVSEYSIQTGGIVAFEKSLLVPVSLYEVALAQDPEHECCTAHGALHRLDATTGEIEWTLHMTPPAKLTGKSSEGVRQFGPSGVPIWSTPTIDTKRGLVYFGTGQNASTPATGLSDSVVAVELASGAIRWHFQSLQGDVFNNACIEVPKGPNCPKWSGPDFDFGAPVIVTRDSEGNDVLIAGQKSGDVFSLDPDTGSVNWRVRVGSGSPLGGVHWGMAVAGGIIFAGVNDPPYPLPAYNPAPGVYALDVDTGEEVWTSLTQRGCDVGMMDYFQRSELYPLCSFFFGHSAPITVAGDAVFSPTLDGKVRAYHAATGEVLWSFDTRRDFVTTTGQVARGGSMDNAGVTFADDMAYMMSGYEVFGELPGNALLAFRLVSGRASP